MAPHSNPCTRRILLNRPVKRERFSLRSRCTGPKAQAWQCCLRGVDLLRIAVANAAANLRLGETGSHMSSRTQTRAFFRRPATAGRARDAERDLLFAGQPSLQKIGVLQSTRERANLCRLWL
jgi:hypothetical protein